MSERQPDSAAGGGAFAHGISGIVLLCWQMNLISLGHRCAFDWSVNNATLCILVAEKLLI